MRIQEQAVFQQGLLAYRGGQYYEAHEYWEELWKDEEDERQRKFLQALIQVTSAIHKIKHNVAPRGAPRLLGRAIERMNDLPDVYGGILLGRLREASVHCQAEIERLLSLGLHGLDDHLVPPMDDAPMGDGDTPPSSRPSATLTDTMTARLRPAEPVVDASQAFRLGVAAYGRRAYYEAQEVWQSVWQSETHPVMKSFVQGLILVAAAMHKLGKLDSAVGAARMLQMASQKLADVPEGTGGMAIALLRNDIDRAKDEIDRLARAGETTLEGAFIPRMQPFSATKPS